MSLRKNFSLKNTLAFRLTLWYAGIFTFCAAVAFLLFYILITSTIRDRSDEELLAQANRLAALYTVEGVDELARNVALEAQAAGVRKVFFRLLSPGGAIFSSSNMSYWQNIGIHKEAIRQLASGANHVFATITVPNRRDKIRVLYVMLDPELIMQIGQTTENYPRFIDIFRWIFIATMAFLVFFAAAVGWFMARQAVSGVEAVTRAARKIAAGTLEERVPVRNWGDEIDQLAITFNEMLDRIQKLIREMKEITDNIAHDLKSPLTRMRGAAEVTLTTGRTTNEYEAMTASTIEECDRLLDMINTMLLISRTEAGIEHPPLTEIDMGKIVSDAWELYGPSAEDKGIKLNCNAPPGMLIEADVPMIRRMIANFLDNAINYTPSGGTVDISVSTGDNQSVILRISDTGPGISSRDLPRIFERFYRGDHSRSMSGTGLGLSLARAIARSHGGDISVDSTPGQGSAFTVTLPKKRQI